MIQIILTKIKSGKTIPIVLIVLLAGVLRFYALERYPSGLNADEAAIGYNAYSLVKTGKDEHGAAWPLVFKSFGDYKPGGYFYLVVPFVKVLGLNVWAVRLPSAMLGVLSVWLVYLLAGELLRLSKFPISNFQFSNISALLLAISPWHVHFSRGGWETNAATTMLLAGVVFFLGALRQRKFLIFSVLFFISSMYTYQSTRLIVPALGLGLVILFRRYFWPPRKEVVISFLLLFLLLLPLAGIVLNPAGLSRFSGVGLTADVGPTWRVNELRGQHGFAGGAVARVLHNKVAAYIFLFGKNYLEHFNGNFLFLSGDPIQRNRVPEAGQLYLIELPLLLLGLWFLIKSGGKGASVVFLWLAVAPLAAALTFQTPHALRAQNMVIPVVIITALGFSIAAGPWARPRLARLARRGLITILIVAYLWNLTKYLNEYYVHYPKTYPSAWEYGFAEVAAKVRPLLTRYDRIIITDTYDQPYVEMLFFLKYPPDVFQQEVVLTPRDRFGFATVRHFGKFDFQPIVWSEVQSLPKTLVIGTPKEIPSQAKVFDTVLSPNNQPAFEFADASP